jgi:hypothetical protein
MDHVDCKGTAFLYYQHSQLVGLGCRLYSIMPSQRESWARQWASLREAPLYAPRHRMEIGHCHREGAGNGEFSFVFTRPVNLEHIIVGFSRMSAAFFLSADTARTPTGWYWNFRVDRINCKWRRVQRWMRTMLAKRRQQRALALAMAWHQRLGAGSAISILPPGLAKGLVSC